MAEHPVYPVESSAERIETLKESVDALMGLTERDMVALVQDRTGFRFMGCPDCDEGTQEGQLAWSIDDPEHVKCQFCGMVYPNEKYPEDQMMRVVNPVGVEVEYPYWEDETGYRYFFTARGWRDARSYFSTRAQELGALYRITGDLEFARRSVLILDAFARHYPGFLVSADWPHRPKGFVLEPPYPNGGGKWGRWRHDEMPSDCVYAYDSICESGELEALSKEMGTDVGRRIEEDFFRGAIRQDDFHGPTYGNASPRIYEGYAAIGRVIGDPELVHEAVRRSKQLFRQEFYEDGFWREGSVGYHQMTMNGMQRVFQALRGYSDPQGYTDPDDGTRFEDLDLERDTPVIQKANRIPEICRYPDGRSIPVHDNWARPGPEWTDHSSSMVLPGYGHAWLGTGSDANQTQLHLHFSGGYGHEHADGLNISLFTKGKELLSDIGYTHTRFRSWSTSTLCHNTVVIDEQRQYTQGDKGPSDGRLLAMESTYDPVQWLEASAENAYPGLAQLYKRFLMMVRVGEEDVYIVDLFRIMGGNQHDWALHGSADEDGTGSVSVSMSPFGENLLPGVKIKHPEGEADRGDAEGRNPSYAYFENVSRGEVTDGVSVTFHIKDSSTKIRSHVAGMSGSEVFLGDAMSFRRAEENDTQLSRFRMPIFLLRRNGEAPLSTSFAAVHEPYDGDPRISGVELNRNGDESDSILTVEQGDVVDWIVHSGGQSGVVGGELELNGETGFVRTRNGLPEVMAIWGGRSLTWGEHSLTSDGTYEGKVVAVSSGEDGAAVLSVDGNLPANGALSGATVVVTFGDGSTRVNRVREATSSSTLILEDDQSFEVTENGARHLFFPHREMDGDVTFRIRASAFVEVEKGNVQSVGEATFESGD